MSPTAKTTVYLDADVYRRLKLIAARRRRSTAQLVREAVAEYALREARPPKPRSIGAGRSGLRNLGSRAEKLLKGMGTDW